MWFMVRTISSRSTRLWFLGMSLGSRTSLSFSKITAIPSPFGMLVYNEVTSKVPMIAFSWSLSRPSTLFMKSVVSFTYERLKSDPVQEYAEKVDEKIIDMTAEGEISHLMAGSMRNIRPRAPHIYFLPKIHKGVTPPPSRPLVSANGCPTEKISAFVDAFLKPLVPEINSYVKDTTDFINKVEDLESLQKDAIIGTLDVTSLYTNIPNREGMAVILEKLKEVRDPRLMPKKQSLVDLSEMVLTMNRIQFNGRQYLQKRGTVMGTRLAPLYANLFMEK